MLEMIMAYAKSIRDHEEGQALVEYALILSLVSIVSIGVLAIVGTDILGVLRSVANALKPGSGDPPPA
jgi:Flp pilus assembly pilin Flp